MRSCAMGSPSSLLYRGHRGTLPRVFRRIAAALLLATACTKGEADRQREDAATLATIVEVDVQVSASMKVADDAARAGDLPKVTATLESASREADDGLRRADGANVSTPWGRSQRETLAALLRDRKREMPRYGAALRGGDPVELLAAVETQAALERRAETLATTIKNGR